jgi:hypothetical protein
MGVPKDLRLTNWQGIVKCGMVKKGINIPYPEIVAKVFFSISAVFRSVIFPFPSIFDLIKGMSSKANSKTFAESAWRIRSNEKWMFSSLVDAVLSARFFSTS